MFYLQAENELMILPSRKELTQFQQLPLACQFGQGCHENGGLIYHRLNHNQLNDSEALHTRAITFFMA